MSGLICQAPVQLKGKKPSRKIVSITECGFDLRGTTQGGRTYYATLDKGANYEEAFEKAVENLQAQAQADRSKHGFNLPVPLWEKEQRQQVDALLEEIALKQLNREPNQQQRIAA